MRYSALAAAFAGIAAFSCSSSDSEAPYANASVGGADSGIRSRGTGGSSIASAGSSGARGAGGARATGGTSGAGGASGGTTSRDGGSGGSVEPFEAGLPAKNPCVEAGTCPTGVWIDVTPPGIDFTNQLDCGNYGTETIAADAKKPGTFYTLFMCQGIWRTDDYGQTWTGPVNTGSQGAAAGDCAGGITTPPRNPTSPPTVYEACIRGNGVGFWRSTNGGVDFTRYNVAPGGARQDFYPPVVDPYDQDHLVMPGHEMNVLVESVDGGQNWTALNTDPGMNQNGGTAEVFFIDTGDPTTTRKTLLWIAQQSTLYGTWRTADGGGTWKQVDKNEHPHGTAQIFQPDANGVVYMAGAYSTYGWGVVRSADYGQTWAHAGNTGNEAVVFGTPKFVYAEASGAIGLGGSADPSFEQAPEPGTGTWTMPGTPAEMKLGAAQAAVANDGQHNVILTANWGYGVWRYIEP